jgi:hypothetical protein
LGASIAFSQKWRSLPTNSPSRGRRSEVPRFVAPPENHDTTKAPREEAERPKRPLGCVVANGRAQDELQKEVMGGWRQESWHQTRMGASTEIAEQRNPRVEWTHLTVMASCIPRCCASAIAAGPGTRERRAWQWSRTQPSWHGQSHLFHVLQNTPTHAHEHSPCGFIFCTIAPT